MEKSNNMNTITYRVGVPVIHRWATGTMRGTGVRNVFVIEEPTVLGGCRAIDKAVERVDRGDNIYTDASPTIDPNPGVEGWPLGA